MRCKRSVAVGKGSDNSSGREEEGQTEQKQKQGNSRRCGRCWRACRFPLCRSPMFPVSVPVSLQFSFAIIRSFLDDSCSSFRCGRAIFSSQSSAYF